MAKQQRTASAPRRKTIVEDPDWDAAADAALELAETAVNDGWAFYPDPHRLATPRKGQHPPRDLLRRVFALLNPNGMIFTEFDEMKWFLYWNPVLDEDRRREERWRLSGALMVAALGWVARLWAAEGLCWSSEQTVFSDYGNTPIALSLFQTMAEGAAGVKARAWPADAGDLPAWCKRPKRLPLSLVANHVQQVVRAAADMQKNIDDIPSSPEGNLGADGMLFRHLDRLNWHSARIPSPWPFNDPCMGESPWEAEACRAASSAHAAALDLAIHTQVQPDSLGGQLRFRGLEWQGRPCHWIFWHPAVRHSVMGLGAFPKLDVQKWSVQLRIEANRLADSIIDEEAALRCSVGDSSINRSYLAGLWRIPAASHPLSAPEFAKKLREILESIRPDGSVMRTLASTPETISAAQWWQTGPLDVISESLAAIEDHAIACGLHPLPSRPQSPIMRHAVVNYLNDLTAACESTSEIGDQSAAKQQEPLHPRQEQILAILDGQAMQTKALKKALEAEHSQMFRDLKPLREAGLVMHKPGLGYYRPDAPPPSARH